MKILVTGVTGFVGQYVLRCLLKTDHEIIATSIEENCTVSAKNLRYISADMNEQGKDWYSLFNKPEILIHLAWQGLPNYGEMYHIEKNLWNGYFFVKQLIESGLRDVTISGTEAEYGKQEGCLSEDVASRPTTAYAVAKDSLRRFLEEYCKKTPFDFKWVRLFFMYGEGQSKHSILQLLKAALEQGDMVFPMSGGEQLRDYLPVETAAENIVKIALQNKVQGIINSGSGVPVSVRRLVEEYLEREGKNIELKLGHYPYKDNESMALWANTEKLRLIPEMAK